MPRLDKGPADPRTLNRYAYARNNPLRLVDPSGQMYDDPSDGTFVVRPLPTPPPGVPVLTMPGGPPPEGSSRLTDKAAWATVQSGADQIQSPVQALMGHSGSAVAAAADAAAAKSQNPVTSALAAALAYGAATLPQPQHGLIQGVVRATGVDGSRYGAVWAAQGLEVGLEAAGRTLGVVGAVAGTAGALADLAAIGITAYQHHTAVTSLPWKRVGADMLQVGAGVALVGAAAAAPEFVLGWTAASLVLAAGSAALAG